MLYLEFPCSRWEFFDINVYKPSMCLNYTMCFVRFIQAKNGECMPLGVCDTCDPSAGVSL